MCGKRIGSARWLVLVVACAAVAEYQHLAPRELGSAELQLKNGLRLEGRLGKISGLADNPLTPPGGAEGTGLSLIVLIDDDLRRTFVSTYQVQQVREGDARSTERVLIRQRVAKQGKRVGGVGPILRVTPFDEWGRRIFSMHTSRGPVDVVQGITEITPVWTKVEGLLGSNSIVWDMRIATSSIPSETLSQILTRRAGAEGPEGRLSVVRLLYESERYKDARIELQKAIREFPELEELQRLVRELRQRSSQSLLREIQLRREGGQHRLAYNMLSNFPVEEVAGETLERVREMLAEYEASQQQGNRVHQLLGQHLTQVQNQQWRAPVETMRDEIVADLNINTLDRMADYLRLADDDQLGAEQKLALAISGWLLGSGSGTENLPVALSLAEVRDQVRRYLRASRKNERDEALQRLQGLEGSSPSYVAKLLAHMKPPLETEMPEVTQSAPAGLLRLSVPGLAGDADVIYEVQLPPEYDPYRRYPAVVTLSGSGTAPGQQIDWWAGAYSEDSKMRLGQASRHGYVVIAPHWSRPHQLRYEYSAREHAAVLYALRDACRRFSIDTDRVFLSGHSMGGDAVWDIGLAHPDLWAGVVPIVAVADYDESSSPRYVSRYWENARYLPWYFIAGELDGDKMGRNARDLDRYLKKTDFDVTVVEYIGRGHEHFQDEIQRIFQWMKLQRRDFFPREFSCVTMRPWDNYFWWVELDNLPTSAMVSPVSWPASSGTRPVVTEGNIYPSNRVRVRSGAGDVTIWLTPDMVDFQQRVEVSVNARSQNHQASPSVETILEDTRTRGDRLHPFWAKVQVSTGRAP